MSIAARAGTRRIIVVGMGCAAAGLAVVFIFYAPALLPVFAALMLMAAAGAVLYLRVQKNLNQLLANVETAANRQHVVTQDLFSIYSMIRVRAPLPHMRGWALSPDAGAY